MRGFATGVGIQADIGAPPPTASASGTHFPPWMRRWPRPRLSASIAPERTEGFGTADLKEAKALLDELS